MPAAGCCASVDYCPERSCARHRIGLASEQRTAAGTDERAPEGGSLMLSQIGVTWPSFNHLRRGIGPRLLVRVLLFSAAVTLILTLFQLYVDYRSAVGAINSRMAEIEGSYLQSLGEGLWNLDSRQLELQIEGILRLPAMRFVEVRETTDRANPMVVSGGRRQDHAAVSREFLLFHTSRGEQQQLGVLSIEATFDEVYR